MRFTIITDTFPSEVNGVAMTLERLCLGLVDRGHEVEVIHPKRDDHPEGEEEIVHSSGIRSLLVPGFPIPKYPELRMGFPFGFQLGERWRTQRPDAIYLATEGLLGHSALGAARAESIPIVSGYHTNFAQYMACYGVPMIEWAVMLYLKSLHNRTFRTLVPSEDIKESLLKEGFENVEVLGRGVDTVLFDPARRSEELRKSWGVSPDDPVALYVGRVAPEKNLVLAIESLIEARENQPRAKLVVVGDGPARVELENRYPELGIHWAGVQRGELLAAHYASSDFFVFPSLTETFGNVLLEAMASGLVSLAFHYAAAEKHLKDGHNGFSIAREDSLAFRRRFREMLSMNVEDRERMAAAARFTAMGISWDSVINRFAEHLIEAANSGSSQKFSSEAIAISA